METKIMTILVLAFAAGFFAAAVLDYFAPGMFGKVKMAGAFVVGSIAGLWDRLPGVN
jgi:NhaP-type Na+/H+ or K+/H+ antiporter